MKAITLTRTQQGLTRGCGKDENKEEGLEKHMADKTKAMC